MSAPTVPVPAPAPDADGDGLGQVRALLLAPAGLRRALASGTRRGTEPTWRRAELRPVQLRTGPHLQLTTYDGTQAHTRNLADGEAGPAVDRLLAEPFTSWHVESTEPGGVRTTRWRVTRKGRVETSSHVQAGLAASVDTTHDRTKRRLLDPTDPTLVALGISDSHGRVKPSRQAKLRQVEEFLRLLDATLDDAADVLPVPTPQRPWRVVDLGCGNAYLTFAAFTHLRSRSPITMTGVDVKEQAVVHNTALAERLGVAEELRFVRAGIATAELAEPPDMVLALHACDTATDDALSRALTWRAPVILAAPCCHHYVQDQLRHRTAPEPYGLLTRDGILRERLADTLTDAMRAALVREQGYRVDVVEFVGSEHTPRNTLLRAVRTRPVGGPAGGHAWTDSGRQYAALVEAWGVSPALAALPREPV